MSVAASDALGLAVICVLAAALHCGSASAAVALANRSLDDGPPDAEGAPPGWQIAVYGAQPAVTLDEPAPGLNGHSLRVHAAEPSDTAIYQDLTLAPGRWHRLSAWVRTEGLQADTRLYGAICACDGPSPYACSPNLGGTNLWQRREVVFRTPPSGTPRVALFFVGFGQGTGTVWFDEVDIRPLATSGARPLRVTIGAERSPEAPIDPRIYGNFIEFVDHHVQGMRAQMLDDVSFEGLLPPTDWCYWQPDKDTEDHPWAPTGEGAERVESGAYNGRTCYRLSAPEQGATGLRQGGLAVQAGRQYTMALYLRQEGLTAPVHVSLGRDYGPFAQSYATAHLEGVTGDWARYSAGLTPDTDDREAELSIRSTGPGALFVDQVTLMPEDHVRGWRRDVVEAVRALRPHCLRFGGSAVIYYDWKQGLGDPDRRVPFPNEPWGRMEPNDVGLDEFLQFCELVEAEPLVCVSYNVGDPADAAAQVEYCNGPVDSQWGRLRAANGHPEPYGVRLWQVGNEQAGPEYESRLAAYCEAMRAVDPSIEICSSFPTGAVVTQAGALLDYLSPHHYSPSVSAIAADIEAQRALVSRCGGERLLRLAITEWNHTAGDWGGPRAWLGTQANALFCARVLHLYQRSADFVAIANRSNLTNSWWAGVVQTSRDSLFVTPAYHAMRLLSTCSGRWPLRVVGDAGQRVGGPETGAPLDIAASIDDGGSALTVSLVNDGADPVAATLDLSAHLALPRPATCHVLAANGPDALNDFAFPTRVAPVTSKLRVGPTLRRSFPPWSLTVIVVRL